MRMTAAAGKRAEVCRMDGWSRGTRAGHCKFGYAVRSPLGYAPRRWGNVLFGRTGFFFSVFFFFFYRSFFSFVTLLSFSFVGIFSSFPRGARLRKKG